MQWVGVAAAIATACLMGLVTAPILRALPEPVGHIDKIPYASLVTARFAIVVAVLSGFAAFIVATRVPPSAWLAWFALVGPGVLSSCIDARTTFLPKVLAHISWLIAGIGVGWHALAIRSYLPILVSTLGVLVLGGFFWAVWKISRGIGFGDVRLMVTIGAVSGLSDPQLLATAVMAGTVLGAAWGIAHRAAGWKGPFPYGPGLLMGPFAALLIQPFLAA